MKFKQSRGMLFLKERGIAFCLRHRLVKLRMKLLEKISLFVFRFFVKRVENYRFAVFFYGLSGHYALRKMFEFLGYEEVKIHDGEFSKCYYNALRKLKGRGEYFLSFRFYDNDLKDYTHNVTKVIKNTNILILVRDPISRLKTLINHGHNIKPYELNALNSPISLDIIRYEGNVKPSCNGLYDALDTLAFNYYSVVKPLLDAGGGGGILYIDTQELMPSCAFETFEKLSQSLEISPPKKALKAKFEYKFWNPLSLLLPYYLYLSSKDFAKIPAIVLHVEENIIKNCQNSYVDIKSYILDPCDLHYENLAINVLKKTPILF